MRRSSGSIFPAEGNPGVRRGIKEVKHLSGLRQRCIRAIRSALSQQSGCEEGITSEHRKFTAVRELLSHGALPGNAAQKEPHRAPWGSRGHSRQGQMHREMPILSSCSHCYLRGAQGKAQWCHIEGRAQGRAPAAHGREGGIFQDGWRR